MEQTAFQLRVLIVEDTPSHVQMIRHMIDRLGYDHEIAHDESGRKAFARLENALATGSALPNVIILDLRLPGESGLQILKKLKAHDRLKHIPVIVNSSYAEADDVSETYKQEGAFFVPKNYDMEHLSAVINQLKIWGRL